MKQMCNEFKVCDPAKKLFDITKDRWKKLKEKRKMRKSQTTTRFFFNFFIKIKLYFVRKHIWNNLVCIVPFV